MTTRVVAVRAYINTDSAFAEYSAGNRIATRDDLVFRVNADDEDEAAEALFVIGNRIGSDLDGRTWPADVRSLSVGDVVRTLNVADPMHAFTWHAVDRIGFHNVLAPLPSEIRSLSLARDA